jgi:hypothetical protein
MFLLADSPSTVATTKEKSCTTLLSRFYAKSIDKQNINIARSTIQLKFNYGLEQPGAEWLPKKKKKI